MFSSSSGPGQAASEQMAKLQDFGRVVDHRLCLVNVTLILCLYEGATFTLHL